MQPLGFIAMQKLLKKVLEILDGTPAVYGKRQGGQSMIELALITPILLIMIAGIVEIGWYAQNYLNLIEAAKVGARRGPFLTAENSPQEWPFVNGSTNGPSTAPFVLDKYSAPVDSADAELIRNDDGTNYDMSTILRYRYRDCGAEVQYFGFFNIIACTVLDSLDPIELKMGENCLTYWRGDDVSRDLYPQRGEPDDTLEPVFCMDDIVVSAFAVQKVFNGVDPTNPFAITLNNPPNGSTNAVNYPAGNQVVVVGRYPSDANECNDGVNTLDGRDPFDFIKNNKTDDWLAPNPILGGEPILLHLELWKYFSEEDPSTNIEFFDRGIEAQRGFAWTGQHIVRNGLGVKCHGSEWSLQDVERVMNLPRFITEDPANDDAIKNERAKYLPSQGIVLVEIFWQHNLLLAQRGYAPGEEYPGVSFPIFSAAYQIFATAPENEIIRAWSFFPVPSAQPNLVFQPIISR